MNRLALLLIACLSLSVSALAEEPPDWAKRDRAAPVDRVCAAALTVVVTQHHEVKGKTGENTLQFHVGITAWSWKHEVELKVTPIDDSHSRVVVGVSRSGGKVSWSSGRKEVKKILDPIQNELASRRAHRNRTGRQ